MDDIICYISAHWVEWLFALCIATLGLAWRTTTARLKAEHDKNEAIAEGVQSLLREAIVSNYNKYSDKGFCPIYAKESVKRCYHAYHDLGGNDVATQLYKNILQMPEEPKGEKHDG